MTSDFAEYYCADNGRPSVPIRTMVGMRLLKSIYNLSDEGVVARWLENPMSSFVSWLLTLVGRLENVLFGNENKSAYLCSTLAEAA